MKKTGVYTSDGAVREVEAQEFRHNDGDYVFYENGVEVYRIRDYQVAEIISDLQAVDTIESRDPPQV